LRDEIAGAQASDILVRAAYRLGGGVPSRIIREDKNEAHNIIVLEEAQFHAKNQSLLQVHSSGIRWRGLWGLFSCGSYGRYNLGEEKQPRILGGGKTP